MKKPFEPVPTQGECDATISFLCQPGDIYPAPILFLPGISDRRTEHIQPRRCPIPPSAFFEQGRLSLAANNTVKAHYLLDFADRRITQLTNAVGSPAELPALIALDEALGLADAAVAQAPAADAPSLLERLKDVVKRSSAALAALQVAPREAPDTYTAAQAKIDALRLLLFGQKFAGNTELSKLSLNFAL